MILQIIPRALSPLLHTHFLETSHELRMQMKGIIEMLQCGTKTSCSSKQSKDGISLQSALQPCNADCRETLSSANHGFFYLNWTVCFFIL